MSVITQSEDPLHALIHHALSVAEQIHGLIEDAAAVLNEPLLQQTQELATKIDAETILDHETISLLKELARDLEQVICEATRVEIFYLDDGVGEPHRQEVVADHAAVVVDLKNAAVKLAARLAEVRRYRRAQELACNIHGQ